MSQPFNIRGVLLSGSSGMLGSELRGVLAALGSEIRRLVRHAPSSRFEIAWNPSAPEPLSPEALDGLDAAIHLSGANLAARRWTRAYKQELIASRVDSTRALALALSSLPHPPKVLLVASGVGIYGDRGAEVLDEFTPAGTGFLADLCRDWEAAARPAVEAGIRVVYLRSGVVLGPGSGALERMAPLFRLGLGGRLGSGAQWMSWIGLKDWVAAVLFLLQTPGLEGPVNLVSPQPVTNAEFTRALGRALGRPAILPAPAWALRLALGEMASEMLLTSARALPGRLVEAGFRFVQPHIDDGIAAALQLDSRIAAPTD